MRRSQVSALVFLLRCSAGILAPAQAHVSAADAGCEWQQTICANTPGSLPAHSYMAPIAGGLQAVDAGGWTPSTSASLPDARSPVPGCARYVPPAGAGDEAELHIKQQVASAATAFNAAPPRAPPIRSRA